MRALGFVVAAVCCLGVLGAQAAEKSKLVKNLEQKKPQTLVVYGTSLTAASEWPKLVKEALDKDFPGLLTMVNSAGSGQHSDWGLANFDKLVLDKKPDTVIIEFAVNDAATRFKISIEKSKANLLAMIDKLQKTNPDVEIILQVMNPLTGAPLERRTNLEGYYQMYREVAKEKGFVLVDHYPTWDRILKSQPQRFSNLVPDGCHPTKQAAKEIVAPAVLKALRGK